MTDELRLNPATEADLDMIEELVTTPMGGEFDWFGFSRAGYRKRWAENGLLDADNSALIVWHADERIGFVDWRRRLTRPDSWFWEIGIGLVPSARGKGFGTSAQRMLVDYLFAHTPAHRIEADTEAENIAEQRALEKAGFAREGVCRAVVFRDGAWRDGVIYAVLRTDPRPPDHE